MFTSPSRIRVCLLATLALGLGSCAENGWKPLFNGTDTTGWEQAGPGEFTVEDGALRTHGGMGLLWYSGEKIDRSEVRIVYKATGRGNSGVFIRIPEAPKDAWFPVHRGYEVQIADKGPDEFHRTGSIYSMAGAEAFSPSSDGWNTMEITLDGPTTIVKVNGETVNTFEGTQSVPPRKQWYEPRRGPRPDAGYIGLQNHDEESVVYFREVSVRPLRN